MKSSDKSVFTVTQQELDALSKPRSPLIYGGVDRFFKWRILFMLAAVIFLLVRLLFYSIDALPVAHALQSTDINIGRYIQFRALCLCLVVGLYLFSYLKDWYFAQISILVFAFGLAALVGDLFNFYFFYRDEMKVMIAVTLVVRVAVLACLFVNAIHVHRAPPMPRRIWS